MAATSIWRDEYDYDPAIIYTLDEDLRFIRCNPAWDRFARDNGNAELTGSSVFGTCIMDLTPSILRGFYRIAYRSVRKFQRQWWHVFDCSSAEFSRSFQMRVLPADANSLLVVNTLIREEPHERQTAAQIEEYTDAEGIVTMCAHCRRVEHLSEPGRSDWMPLLLIATGTLVQHASARFASPIITPIKAASSDLTEPLARSFLKYTPSAANIFLASNGPQA